MLRAADFSFFTLSENLVRAGNAVGAERRPFGMLLNFGFCDFAFREGLCASVFSVPVRVDFAVPEPGSSVGTLPAVTPTGGNFDFGMCTLATCFPSAMTDVLKNRKDRESLITVRLKMIDKCDDERSRKIRT